MMLLSEFVFDLFLCDLLDFVKLSIMFSNSSLEKDSNLCLSAYISEITHHNHIQAYLLENYKVTSCTTRSVPI